MWIYPVRADVRTDEKSRVELAGVLGKVVNIFGGKGAREGSRLPSLSKETAGRG